MQWAERFNQQCRRESIAFVPSAGAEAAFYDQQADLRMGAQESFQPALGNPGRFGPSLMASYPHPSHARLPRAVHLGIPAPSSFIPVMEKIRYRPAVQNRLKKSTELQFTILLPNKFKEAG